MDVDNLTTVNEFILIGFSDLPEVCCPLFVVFAIIYQVTFMGNGTILLAIGTEKKVHTPMYCFLANFSLVNIFCPSATVPKMLESLLIEKQSISFLGCALQLYFLVTLARVEFFLLATMGYDRYVTICFPLSYTLIMTKACYVQQTAGTWAEGFLHSLLLTVSTFHLSFCKSNQVNQCYCDIPPVVALSCSSTYVAEMPVLVEGGVLGISVFLITFISYICITFLHPKNPVSQREAQSLLHMCFPLLVACLFYGTAIFTYIRPSSSRQSPACDRLISVLYGVITPMLNPKTYSLRNTEVKGALKNFLCHKKCLQLT